MPMQYNTIVGSLGTALSGGQKQRVLLARALYRKPHIVFLDEAFDQLDLANEGFPEFFQRRGPGLLAPGHRVELVLHRGRKAIFDIAVKVLGEKSADNPADVGGGKASVVDFHVFAIAQRGNN